MADGGGALARRDPLRHEGVPRHRRLRQHQAQDGRRQDERIHVPGGCQLGYIFNYCGNLI